MVVHAKCLINLASPEAEDRERSRKALANELAAAASLSADLVVVHAGSHGGSGEEEGMERLVEGLHRARELAREVAPEPAIENSVGAGTQLCSSFDVLAQVAQEAGVRACIDTAHAVRCGVRLLHAAGGGEDHSQDKGVSRRAGRRAAPQRPEELFGDYRTGTRGSGRDRSTWGRGRSFLRGWLAYRW